MAWPAGSAKILSLGKKTSGGALVKDVGLLGCTEALKWKQQDDALVIDTPSTQPCEAAYVFKIQLSKSSHLMSAMRITQNIPDQITSSVTLFNHDKKEWNEKVFLFVHGRKAKYQKVTVKPNDAFDVHFIYEQKMPSVKKLSMGYDDYQTEAREVAFPMVLMSGPWKFKKGNDEAWKNPDFNDEDWQTVQLPNSWEKTSHYTENQVYGWYRRMIDIPAEWRNRPIVLTLGKMDDVDETYFNGKKIGGMGSFPPEYVTAYSSTRRYVVVPENIEYGEPNCISIKVYDEMGDGGIYTGPMGTIELMPVEDK